MPGALPSSPLTSYDAFVNARPGLQDVGGPWIAYSDASSVVFKTVITANNETRMSASFADRTESSRATVALVYLATVVVDSSRYAGLKNLACSFTFLPFATDTFETAASLGVYQVDYSIGDKVHHGVYNGTVWQAVTPSPDPANKITVQDSFSMSSIISNPNIKLYLEFSVTTESVGTFVHYIQDPKFQILTDPVAPGNATISSASTGFVSTQQPTAIPAGGSTDGLPDAFASVSSAPLVETSSYGATTQGLSTGIICAVAAGSFAVVAVLLFLLIWCWRRKLFKQISSSGEEIKWVDEPWAAPAAATWNDGSHPYASRTISAIETISEPTSKDSPSLTTVLASTVDSGTEPRTSRIKTKFRATMSSLPPVDTPPAYVGSSRLSQWANEHRDLISESLEARLTTVGYMPSDNPDNMSEERWTQQYGVSPLELTRLRKLYANRVHSGS